MTPVTNYYFSTDFECSNRNAKKAGTMVHSLVSVLILLLQSFFHYPLIKARTTLRKDVN
jgi:hypothetical protein